MKFKFLSFSLICAIASTFVSCQNTDEPIPVEIDSNEELVEYYMTVNIPDELKTRTTSNASIGASGLYEFPERTIDKLWYAVYYNGSYKTSGEVVREDEKPFSVSYRMTGSSDPSLLYFFFWAGNSDDDVLASPNLTLSSWDPTKMITIAYKLNTLSYTPAKLHNNSNLQIFDSFTGYIQFSDNKEISDRSRSITLKRPFALFHVISDDFTDTDLAEDYPNGFTTLAGFGSEKPTTKDFSNHILNVSTWNYSTNEITLFKMNDYFSYNSSGYYTQNLEFYFKNDLKGTQIETVNFKNRQMDYLTCFFTLAPPTLSHLKYENKNVDKLNLAIKKGSATAQDYKDSPGTLISIPLPEEGIKANNQYIIYNTKRSEGGTGFLEGVYNYQILVNNDGTWENPSTEHESDKL